MKLFEVMAHYQAILDKEELTAEDEQFLIDAQDDIRTFVINMASYIKNLEAEANCVSDALDEMKERLGKLNNQIANKRKFLLTVMRSNQIEKITDHPYFAIKIRKGRDKVDIYDYDKIDKKYFVEKVSTDISKTLIKDDIEKGIVVDGARMIREDTLAIG